MVVTLPVSHPPMSWLKLALPPNISYISITWLVFHSLRVEETLAFLNMARMLVTLDVSQLEMS